MIGTLIKLTLLALQLAHLISLDVFCIAFAWCSLVAGECSGQAVELWQPLVIGCSVWIAYTIDRLNDGRSLDRSRPHWSRHIMHYRYNKCFWACLTLVLSLVAVVVQSIASFMQVCYGLILTVLAGLYFWLHGRVCNDAGELWRPITVGCLFSCGVCLPAFVEAGFRVQSVLVMLCLGSLFSFNASSVAWFERAIDDAQNGHGGGSHHFWRRSSSLATIVLQLISLLLVIGFMNLSSVFKWTYLAAALLLALNFVAFGRLKTKSRSSSHESTFILQMIDARDMTRLEHVGSCFAEASLWAPAGFALCLAV